MPNPSELESRLQRWSRFQALAMLCASLAAAWVGRPWPVAALGLVSFAGLIAQGAGSFTPSGAFGVANAVTALRVLLTSAIGLALHGAPGLLLAVLLLVIFALDLLDGALARRRAQSSAFGAHFDMEADALLVLLLGLELWQRGRLGVWIVSAGLLRYAYVLSLAIVPARRGEVPRSRFGRLAALALGAGLGAALAFDTPAGSALAALGTLLVVASFAQSFVFSYTRRAP